MSNILRKTTILSGLVAALLVSGCANNDGYGGGYGNSILNKENAGALLGGAAGAWAGSNIGGGSGRIVATAVGAVAGALIGSQIGGLLDDRDQQELQRTTYNALEDGRSYQPVRWENPDSGRYGTVTPERAYRRNGLDCRPYTQTVFIDGRAETARGNACRNSDGSWQIAN